MHTKNILRRRRGALLRCKSWFFPTHGAEVHRILAQSVDVQLTQSQEEAAEYLQSQIVRLKEETAPILLERAKKVATKLTSSSPARLDKVIRALNKATQLIEEGDYQGAHNAALIVFNIRTSVRQQGKKRKVLPRSA